MMTRVSTNTFSFFLILMPFFLFQGGWEGDWKLEKDKEGIKVYTRKAVGSTIKDSRAEMQLTADPEVIFKAISDATNHVKWMDRCAASKILEQTSSSEYIVYYEADAPWPVSDRDLIARWNIERKKDGSIILKSKGIPEHLPEKDGFIRVPEISTQWEIHPAENGKVNLVYYNHASAGGSIPDWLANSTATDSPFVTFKNLREMIK